MEVNNLVGAELRRAFCKGGLVSWICAGAILGWLSGALIIYLAVFMADDVFTELGYTEVLGTASLPPALLLVVATSNYVTRDIDSGMFTLNKLLSTSRIIIIAARFAAWTLICVFMQLIAIVPPLLVATTTTIKPVSLTTAVVSITTLIVVSIVLTLLVYALAMIVRKGSYVMIVSTMLVIGIPLLLNIAALFIPTLSDTLIEISTWFPGTAAVRASTIPGINEDAQVDHFIEGWLTLLAWLAAGVSVAFALFRRESFDFRD